MVKGRFLPSFARTGWALPGPLMPLVQALENAAVDEPITHISGTVRLLGGRVQIQPMALLAQWLRQGLRNQQPTAIERARELVAALERLVETARRVRGPPRGSGQGRAAWWTLVVWLGKLESARGVGDSSL